MPSTRVQGMDPQIVEGSEVSSMLRIVDACSRTRDVVDGSAMRTYQQRLAGIAFRIQRRRWDVIVEESLQQNCAILQVYMSDGWSCDMSESIAVEYGTDKRKYFRRENGSGWSGCSSVSC